MKTQTWMMGIAACLATEQAHARFLSADPVPTDPDNGQNFNRYAYANNNPYTNIDPDGRQVFIPSNSSQQNVLRATAVNSQAAVIRGAGERNAGKLTAERVSLNAKGTAAAGTGITATKNLAGNGNDSIGWVPVGQGLYAGATADFKIVDGFSLFNGAKETPFSFEASGDIGAIGSIGGSISLDPGGQLDVSISVGVGMGEHTSFAPTLSVNTENNDIQDTKADEKLRKQ